MADKNGTTNATEAATYDWTQIVDDLNRLLRLRTTPIDKTLRIGQKSRIPLAFRLIRHGLHPAFYLLPMMEVQ